MTSSPSYTAQPHQRSQVTGFTIKELPPMTFPPLPPIKDKALYDVVVTHSSFYQSPRRSSMELNPQSMIEDYEKLEHVGDAILGAMIAILLHDLVPLLGEGPATTLKASLVSNATLARISDAYGIPAKLRAEPSATRMTRTQVKTRASMFEAWIAGVFYSVLNGRAAEEGEGGEGGYEGSDESEDSIKGVELEDVGQATGLDASSDKSNDMAERIDEVGVPQSAKPTTTDQNPVEGPVKSAAINDKASSTSSAQDVSTNTAAPLTATSIEEPDDAASSPTPSQTPSDSTVTLTSAFQELTVLSNQNLKYRWFAMIALDDWLRPLFTPIAHYALAELKKEQIRLIALEEEQRKVALSDMAGIGSVGLLNTHVNQDKIGTLTYEAEAVEEGWRMTLTLVKADGSIVTTQEVRKNQKAAKTWAAHVMCEKLGI